MLEITKLFYAWPGAADPILSIEQLTVGKTERVFLRGRSGSGKSTLLAAIAGVVDVAVGSVSIAATDIGALGRGERDRFRGDHVGIIFQLFNLVPYLSAFDNVVLPCRFSVRRRQQALQRGDGDLRAEVTRLLTALGLSDRRLIDAPSAALSVGQQQRVAAARALIGAPDLVLADEPTSALDQETKGEFIELLLSECGAAGSSLLFVSHDPDLERHFDRALDFGDVNHANAVSG